MTSALINNSMMASSENPIYTKILSNLNYRNGRGLEIGPLARPIAKKEESNVLYVDHCSTESLKKKYNGIFEEKDIQDVDIDLTKCSLLEGALPYAPFDYVIASHVAEHIPDFIGWLKDISLLLSKGGVLALVMPDKRFTFDINRRVTPFWQCQQAHEAKLTRPSRRMVADHFLNVILVHDAAQLWNDYHRIASVLGRDAGIDEEGVSGPLEIWSAGHYVDTHCLVTTPWDFVSLVGEAVSQYNIPLVLRAIETTPANLNEFYVYLEHESGHPFDWQAAARHTYRVSPHPEILDRVTLA